MKQAKLKPGKDVPVRAGHPWIFSEALASLDLVEPGELVTVTTASGERLGTGYANPKTSIRVRMLTNNEAEKIDAVFFAERIRALDAWKRAHLPPDTDGYRVVHAEVDGLPGLILDRYGDVCVFQLHTAGAELLRESIVKGIEKALKPSAIVERSDVEARRQEGLKDLPVEVRMGELPKEVTFRENGIVFVADVMHGQKTGFFLDQREARLATGRLAKGRRVVNLFSYSGAFSVHAAKGGASSVLSVDVSRRALELAERNFELNGLDQSDESKYSFLEANVFDLLADEEAPLGDADMIVCDPPAFAKSGDDVPQAIKAYMQLNTNCLRRLPVGGILVTSSCSGRVDPEAFRSLLRIAAGRAGRDVRVLAWIGHPVDHAERLAFPEGRYLKTAILEVTSLFESTWSS